MSIAISPDHVALADSVRSLMKRTVPSDYLHAELNAKQLSSAPAYWGPAADMGLFGLHIPDDVGGQGFGYAELAVVVEEFARAAAPGPFVPTVLASAVIALVQDDQVRKDLLPGLADGSRRACVALAANLTGTYADGSLSVSGTADAVLGASAAELFVVPVIVDEAQLWVAIAAEHVTVTAVDSVDRLRPIGDLSIGGVAGEQVRLLDGVDTARVRTVMGTLLAAEASGIAAATTEMASDYAKVREQFGRPIGQFQAVKHKCANMLVESERAAATAWNAARTLDDATSDHGDLAAVVAAVLASKAALHCAQDAIQILGGIGFTWEHDVHLYYRRALGIAAALGRASDWTADVTRLALKSGLPKTQIDMPEGTDDLRAQIRSQVTELAALKGREQADALADGGWVVPHLPKPWGRGADALEQVIIHQELAAAKVKCPDIALAAWMVPSLIAHGTPEQQQRYLPATLRGEHFWCQLFSEPGAGSDLAALTTKAIKVDGGWRLTGSKVWNSLAQFADLGFCLARTSPDVPKHEGISYFLVDMKADGVTVRPLRELTGSALFNEVFLDEVFVPDEDVVGAVDKGWEVARNTLSNERVSLGNRDIPLYASLDGLIDWAAEAELDAIAVDGIGQLIAQGFAVRLLNQRSTIMAIDGTDPGGASSVSKLLNMRFGQDASEFVQSEFGHAGAMASESAPAGKWSTYLLAGRATTIYGGTSEIQLNIIAERILGLPRDPVPAER